MQTITTIDEVRTFIENVSAAGKSIGFVPTMGDLHEGHLALVRKSKEQADITVVSIFVNPTQFGPNEDYEKYHRNLEGDSALCRQEGVDMIFAPEVQEMYPAENSVVVDELSLSKHLCGSSRPGHFRGVLTVVAKLFNIVQPDMAFFGQKDAQQARIIRQMISDLNFPVKMFIVPTVRDDDGLALSSRNSYLTKEQRQWAPRIYQSLQKAVELYQSGVKEVAVLKKEVAGMLTSELSEIDYVDFVSWQTMTPVTVADDDTLLAVAVKVGSARLIDNIFLNNEYMQSLL